MFIFIKGLAPVMNYHITLILDLYWNIVLICLNNSTHTKIGSITATTIPRWLARLSEVICAGLLAIGVAYFVLTYGTLSFSVTA